MYFFQLKNLLQNMNLYLGCRMQSEPENSAIFEVDFNLAINTYIYCDVINENDGDLFNITKILTINRKLEAITFTTLIEFETYIKNLKL